jgi:hypothetical protein
MNPTPTHARPRPSGRPADARHGRLLLTTALIAGLWLGGWSPALAQAPTPSVDAPEAWVGGPGSANYRLAARFAPYKLERLIRSTSINPRWIEGTERFWYQWDTSEGSYYYIGDPAQGTRHQIFDNDRLAAELTRITRDP